MRTSSYHPMGNGQPERFNRTLLTMIGTLSNANKADWQNWVNHLTHAYNCTKSQVTGYSPFFLMFRREQGSQLTKLLRLHFLSNKKKTHDYIHNLCGKLQWAYQIAKEHIDKDAARRQLYYDRKYHCMEIIPGDIVLVRQRYSGQLTKSKIGGRFLSTKYLRSMVTDPFLKFKGLELLAINQIKNLIEHVCTHSSV